MSQRQGSDRPDRKRGRRRWALRVAAGVVCLALGLAVGEAICRVAVTPQPPVRFQQGAQVFDEDGLGRFFEKFEPDPDLFWRLAPDQTIAPGGGLTWRIISNGQRLREDHEIPVPKPRDQMRQLFLGDSCTFGFGIPVQDTFVEQVEDNLRRSFPGKSIESVNAGVPAYTIYQGWRYLVRDGLELDPDVVLVCFGNNDRTTWDHMSDFEHHRRLMAIQPPGPLRWSRLCRLTWATLYGGTRKIMARPRLTTDEFRQLLGKIKDTTDERNIGLMIIVWVWRNQAMGSGPPTGSVYQRELIEFCEAESVPIVNLFGIMRQLCSDHPVGDVYLDQLHPTGKANARIARTIAPAIASWYRNR